MAILGIYDGHNAGAALIDEETGRMVAAVEEERFSRVKNHDGRCPDVGGPFQSVAYCVARTDEPITLVALGLMQPDELHRHSVNTFLDTLRQGEGQRLNRAGQLGLDYHDLLRIPLLTQRERVKTCLVAAQNAGVNIQSTPVEYVPHHRAHAATAYYFAPIDDALVLTLDGKGDDLSGSISRGTHASLKVSHRINALQSLGHVYSAFTVACGMRPQRDEGKLMALAASGSVDEKLLAWLTQRISFDPVSGELLGGLNQGLSIGPYPDRVAADHNALARSVIVDIPQVDAAATVQTFVEDLVCKLARHYLRIARTSTLAVAGGVFANVSINRRLAELDAIDQVYVHPAMTDSGIAAGAAASAFAARHARKPEALQCASLGPTYPEQVAVESFRSHGYAVVDIPAEIGLAKALSRGAIVARFVGGVEYGPRALGNRSVFAPSHDPEIAKDLNTRLGRSQVMPFAPIAHSEDADRLFLQLAPVSWSSKFMTVAVDCSSRMRNEAPAAVHADGSARPQIVSDDPRLTLLLKMYRQLTRRSTIINTSFNLHDEPIVCSPRDASSTAHKAGIDVVQVESRLCVRGERSGIVDELH